MMLPLMLLAHLLGDYQLQFDALVRWKKRSIVGLLVHGAIVTLSHLALSMLVTLSWWPYALLIGAVHTLIDVVRACLIRTKDATVDMLCYLVDQVAHVVVIVLVIRWSGAPLYLDLRLFAGIAVTWQIIFLIFGYVLLLQPAWVLLRFIVRGVWGQDAAPDLGTRDKYAPMVERVMIATSVITGQFYLAPLVLLPRRLRILEAQQNGVVLWAQLTTHWAETLLGTLLSVGVGLILRLVFV